MFFVGPKGRMPNGRFVSQNPEGVRENPAGCAPLKDFSHPSGAKCNNLICTLHEPALSAMSGISIFLTHGS